MTTEHGSIVRIRKGGHHITNNIAILGFTAYRLQFLTVHLFLWSYSFKIISLFCRIFKHFHCHRLNWLSYGIKFHYEKRCSLQEKRIQPEIQYNFLLHYPRCTRNYIAPTSGGGNRTESWNCIISTQFLIGTYLEGFRFIRKLFSQLLKHFIIYQYKNAWMIPVVSLHIY